MESIALNVRDLAPIERKLYEDTLGESLKEDQQIIVRVLTPPSQDTRQRALEDLQQLSDEGSTHREALGIADEELNEILEEARDQARQHKN